MLFCVHPDKCIGYCGFARSMKNIAFIIPISYIYIQFLSPADVNTLQKYSTHLFQILYEGRYPPKVLCY